jgi:hypothetical protein
VDQLSHANAMCKEYLLLYGTVCGISTALRDLLANMPPKRT